MTNKSYYIPSFTGSILKAITSTLKIILPLLFCLLGFNCQEKDHAKESIYKYIKPQYSLTELHTTADTLHFIMNEHMYNVIKSFNLFRQQGNDYIAFFDDRSGSVNVYDFHLQKLEKSIFLKPLLPGNKLYKTTVYCKNFDTILVTNKNKLYLLDSAGAIKQSIHFLEKPENSLAVFENTNPAVFRKHSLYVSVRPYVKETSFDALKEWKVLYKFDFQKGKASLHYPLPKLYQENLFGYHFLDYSYCFNHHGNFVFSFPADTNIYETNLTDYHTAYYGKSRFQADDIQPLSKKDLATSEDGFKNYVTRDSYGPIYFDSSHKRYLRIAKSRISESAYQQKNLKRKYHIIIFNEDFKIIGESEINDDISLDTIFFTADGNIYARAEAKDEYALHFVRLIYNDNIDQPSQLTKK